MSYESMDGYEPQSLEADVFLSDVPISLIKENIKSQFDSPMNNRMDYVTTFIDNYDFSKEQCTDDDELKVLRGAKDDLFSFIRSLFWDYLGISFPDFEDRDEDDQDELIRCTYRYFIINMKKNFVNMVLHYIDERKEEVLGICVKKKDVTTLAYKKQISNPDDVLILSNLNNVVKHVISSEIYADDFIRYSRRNNDYEGEYIETAFDEDKITGNFVPEYCRMVKSQLDIEIVNKVRQKIFNEGRK